MIGEEGNDELVKTLSLRRTVTILRIELSF